MTNGCEERVGSPGSHPTIRGHMNLIVVDTETSDLPENGGHILELAWYVLSQVDHKWVPTSCFETYIQFAGLISPMAQAQNHIRVDCLTAARGAKTRENAITRLLQDIQPDTFLVAHNVKFDSKFLPELANPWICTYRVAKLIWPEAPSHSNQVLRYWLNTPVNLAVSTNIKTRHPHQALYDVATTTGILQKMLERHSPQELAKMTSCPALLRKMPFGKHKGVDFDKVPRDYLFWLRQQSNLDPDVRYTIDSML